MKLLADENIPFSVVSKLTDGGYDVVWIRTESPGISDIDVMKYASREKRIILTYDKDFGELVVKDKICPSAGIILLRLPLKTPTGIAEYILSILRSRTDWEGNFSVIDEKRIRMRPIPPHRTLGR